MIKEDLKGIANIRVFVCVPGTGKTYLSKKYKDKFVDLGAIKTKYKYNLESVNDEEFELMKGQDLTQKKYDVTEYVTTVIKSYLRDSDKIILLSPHPSMLKMLIDNNIPFCLIYPSKDCKEELIQRYKQRGNTESFINQLLSKYEEFYNFVEKSLEPAYKIMLKKGEYISDLLLPLVEKKEKN